MGNKTLNYYITKYFSDYLPVVKGVSINTIISYRDTFIDLLQYCEKNRKVILKNISLTSIEYRIIEDYLKYLEEEKGNSISTRNQRLSCIHSFYQYLQKGNFPVLITAPAYCQFHIRKLLKNYIIFFKRRNNDINKSTKYKRKKWI